MSYRPPQSYWHKRQRLLTIPENETEEEKERIQKENEKINFNNSICCSKKAYFFGYVYPRLMDDYKRHKRVYNNLSMAHWGMSINDLIKIVDKSPEQKKLLKQYYNFSPLFNSKSSMNILCKYFEDFDFDFRFRKVTKKFDYRIYMSKDYKDLDKKKLARMFYLVKDNIRIYANIIKAFAINKEFLTEDERREERNLMISAFFDYFKDEVLELAGNSEDAVNYLVEVIYNQKNGPKFFLWHCFGYDVAENVKKNSIHRYSIVEDPNGFEYFGRKYTLVDNPVIGGE